MPHFDNPVRVQRTVPVVSPWFRGRALGVGSLHRWTRHLSVAARQTPPSTLLHTQKLAATEMPFCFAGNLGSFVWSPAFRRSRPAKAGTPCNFPRRPCFVSVFRDAIGPRTRYREEALFSLLKPSHGVPPCGSCSAAASAVNPWVGFSGIASEEQRWLAVRESERRCPPTCPPDFWQICGWYNSCYTDELVRKP